VFLFAGDSSESSEVERGHLLIHAEGASDLPGSQAPAATAVATTPAAD
jgi:hypothetical protein